MQFSMIRFAFAVLVPLSIAGCVSNGAASPGSPSGTRYELDAKTEFKIGIREYAVTDYTYWQIDGAKKTKLWSAQYNQAYAYHWIAPSGRVWIITSALPGPGSGGAGLYVFDKKGDLKGRWGYTAGGKTAVDLDPRSAVVELRPGVEQVRIVRHSGVEQRVTQVCDSAGNQLYSFSQELKAASTRPEGTLEEVLADPTYDVPQLGQTLAAWTYRIFSATKKGDSKPSKSWRQYAQQIGEQAPIHFRLTGEEPLERPTLMVRTPGRYIMEFHLEGEHPSIDILKQDGSAYLRKIDLVEAGKMTPAEAISAWSTDKVRYQGGGWQPLSKLISAKDFEQTGADIFDTTDSKGLRHLIQILEGGKVEYTVKEGFATRDPKETAYSSAPIVDQRTYKSPNGKFVFRVRQRDGGNAGRVWNATLLAAVPEGGEIAYVELWSNFWIGRFNWSARVFDNGVTAYASEDGEFLKFVDATGNGMGDLSPEARGVSAKIDVRDLSIKVTGDQRSVKVDGIDMTLPTGFDILWKTPSKTLVYHAAGMSGTYRLWWSEPPTKR